MKIILIKDVEGLGVEGDLVDAKIGYARNYLIPKGVAIEATPGNMRKWESQQVERAERKEKEEEEALKLKGKIEEEAINIEGKSGEGGRLFGSITSTDIAEALKAQQNIDIDKRRIELKDNIKTLGTTEVSIRVYPEIVATLRVNVKEQ